MSESNKERFIRLCGSIERPGIDNLLVWLEKTDFFIAPASTKYHGSYPGGLVEHSLNVYDELSRLLKAYPEIEVSNDSILISTLFHDLCKLNFYTVEKRNRKNDKGVWEQYDYYAVNEGFCFGGHGSKSLYILQRFIDVIPEEAVAINCHMSCWDTNNSLNIGKAYEQFPFAWLVHVADEAATYIKERRDA